MIKNDKKMVLKIKIEKIVLPPILYFNPYYLSG